MESVYWVMAWACHRRCRHCYEDRFRPYVGAALDRVIAEAAANAPCIVANLPERLTYRDRTDPRPDGTLPEKPGRIILSGGEALIDPVREAVTYKVIDALRAKYADQGVRIIVQTTGDILTDAIVADLLARGVWMISVASVDDFHVGLEGEARQQAFMARLSAMFGRHGMRPSGFAAPRIWFEEEGPVYSFFGAQPDSWIGNSGRAAAPGRTAFPPRHSPTISAAAGPAASTSSTTGTTARRCRSSPTGRSIPAASRRSCRSAT